MRHKMTAVCSECDATITIPNDAVSGEIVTCPECGASFELVEPNASSSSSQSDDSKKFDLKPAQTVGEDWGQ